MIPTTVLQVSFFFLSFFLSRVSTTLNNEELHNLYSSPNKIRMIGSRRVRWTGQVARMGQKNAYMVLVGVPDGKRSLKRPRIRRNNNIKLDLRERGWIDTDWINLAQDIDMRVNY
jgi:hypothetical protein